MVTESKLTPPSLIALVSGLLPYADPLVCGDLTGPYSLLGESAKIPRPVCSWQCDLVKLFDSSAERNALQQSVVLWQETGEANSHLAVQAVTFLAGGATSTFDIAWQLAAHGLFPEWGSVLCSVQSQGRGQLRREWYSPQGNLYASLRLPDSPLFVSSAGAVVVGFLFVKALNSLGYDVKLKWPNDILAPDGCKVGGILLEERGGTCIVGVGINLCEAPSNTLLRRDHATQASVLLSPLATEPTAPFVLWQPLVREITAAYTHYLLQRELSAVLLDAERLLAWKGSHVVLAESDVIMAQGMCLGFGPSGGLLIQSKECIQEYTSGSLRVC